MYVTWEKRHVTRMRKYRENFPYQQKRKPNKVMIMSPLLRNLYLNSLYRSLSTVKLITVALNGKVIVLL